MRRSVAVLGAGLLLLCTPRVEAQKRIALSFDDVPRHAGAFFTPDQRAIRLIAALDRAGVEQAGFFVTTGNLKKPDGDGGADRIRAYVAAGHVLGNHSTTHPWLSRTEVEDYLEDLDQAEAWLVNQPGHRPWFRYPYLDEGRGDIAKRDALRAALQDRGLLNAYITVDNYDWHLDAIASSAQREGKAMNLEGLRDLYVETLVQVANFYEAIAKDVLDRSPAHVLLLHETDLAALFIEDLVVALRLDGWQVIPIDEAYQDPIAHQEPETTYLGSGRVAALAHVAGWSAEELVHERTDEEVLNQLFQERVLATAETTSLSTRSSKTISSEP
ncbi:MAG: polysaccharide deacetylase family protein [Thermoanaerobaculia bacterium]|nr:polysaccharide deacetylase family protein [Thermoanaerobaculia bacterium]